MKRALALFTVLLFGVAAFAQVSGSWSGKIQLLPSSALGLDHTQLVLKGTVAGFEITSTSYFTGSGFSSQEFGISGTFGPAEISGVMGFDAMTPAYGYADLSASLNFAGVGITGKVFHGVYPYGESYFNKHYSPYTFDDVYEDVCQTAAQTGSVLMFYTLETVVEPISVTAHFADCCTGIEFYDVTISLEDLSLCCGITYDFELHFTKAGFDYALFSIDKLFDLCCGISFGVDVKFTTDAKEVSPSFSWGGIEGCVTVWGDVVQTAGNTFVDGWELYGYKIYCELAECYSLEIVTAFDVDAVESIIGDVFKDQEFEYVKLSACGPACCGGTWNLSVTTYFGGGTLFDIHRYTVDVSLPIMDALTISLSFESPSTLYVGWEFTF